MTPRRFLASVAAVAVVLVHEVAVLVVEMTESWGVVPVERCPDTLPAWMEAHR